MNFETFCASLTEELQKLAGEEAEITVRKIRKNNGVILNGLSIREDDGPVAPVFYLEDCWRDYQGGITIREFAERLYREHKRKLLMIDVRPDAFSDFSRVREHLFFRLINAEMNASLLADTPHRRIFDLAAVYYFEIPELLPKEGTALVNREMMEYWGQTEETLMRRAFSNTVRSHPPLMQEIGELLMEMEKEEGMKITSGEERLLVLTNDRKQFGAGVMLYPGVLQKASEQKQTDLWVIPSSVHETILVPDRGRFAAEELEHLIAEVNATQLRPEEILSGRVYRYSREEGRLKMGEEIFPGDPLLPESAG